MSVAGPRVKFLSAEEKANKPKITWSFLKRIWSYLAPYWVQLFLALLTIIASATLTLYPSILTGRIIDEGLIAGDLSMLLKLVLLSFGVTLAGNLLSVCEEYINTWVAEHITFNMRNSMFKKLQTLSHRFFMSNNQGDVITRMTTDISGVKTMLSSTLTKTLTHIITLVVALIAMFNKNWLLALVGVALVPLFTIPTHRVGKTRWAITSEAQKRNDEMNGILSETLSVSGQLLVKLFTNEKREYDHYESVNREMTRLNIKESMAGRWFKVTVNTITSVGPMVIYFIGGLIMMRYDHSLTVGDITVMVTLLGNMYKPVQSLLNIQVDAVRSMALFDRIFKYFDLKAEVENKPDALVPESIRGTVAFNDVSFYYNTDRKILSHISFDLKEGRTIAIVGPSGAGKSTIVNLIPRLYDVTEGSIVVGGYDVRDLDLTALRRSIGVVTQDTYLFNGTIKENLLYANFNATDDEIISACKKANIHDFIASQTNGYDTMVGNRGLKLSGGEKQRLSIARAILKNPSILIFDEATSSLDSISENLIQEAIDPLVEERTSIVIAHRLSTIIAADEILVVSGGKIVERGKHHDLVNRGGIYTELYETQFRRALEDHDRLNAEK